MTFRANINRSAAAAQPWLVYPASWLVVLAGGWAVTVGVEPLLAAGTVTVALAVAYIAVEIVAPFREDWRMTWASVYVDAKYVTANIVVIEVTRLLLAGAAIGLAGRSGGWGAQLPWWGQLALMALVFEGLNYALHRAMHLPKRAGLGRLLWPVHVAHHLPDCVYFVRHAVFHPLNTLLSQAFTVVVPVWLVGYDPVPVALFVMLLGMHAMISHANVHVRMGWLNYLFVGPELHRQHHACGDEGRCNYGVLVPWVDLAFGTFRYRPSHPPDRLGVDDAPAYPALAEFVRVLALPFRRAI